MKPETWPAIWDLYTGFQKQGPNSAILIERYNLTAARAVPPGESALQNSLRHDAFAQAIVIPWYSDEALDGEAQAFGESVRRIWSDKMPTENPTYANFAHGDESLEAIYGESVPRLKDLKTKWDPKGVFSQWFSIK
jgi:FAD/FMN-containing dehydrogenase